MKKTPIILLFSSLLISPNIARAKDYYFPEVRVELNVDKNGDFTVDEFRTYAFQGSFSSAYLSIPLLTSRGGRPLQSSLADFTVSDEQGRLLEAKTNLSKGVFEASWNYSANNERRTFHIRYRIIGAILSYPDVTELYWQVIGNGWTKPTKKVLIDVRLPEPVMPRGNIKVWGHGPLTGKAMVLDERTARFTAADVRPQQYVEVRVAWPSGMVLGVASTAENLESINRQEGTFAQETVDRLSKQITSQRSLRSKGSIGFVGLILLLGLLAIPLISLLPMFFYLMTLRKSLLRCSLENRMMQPGLVWLMMIPVFNVIWHFIIVKNIASSLGREFQKRGIVTEPNPGQGLGTAVCILNLIEILPFVGLLTAVPGFVCWILYWAKISKYSSMLGN